MVATPCMIQLHRVHPLQVLDEAYIEFAGEESKLKWVQKHDNLVVLRTFSKSAGVLKESDRPRTTATQLTS